MDTALSHFLPFWLYPGKVPRRRRPHKLHRSYSEL
jgi:hypothetical protein